MCGNDGCYVKCFEVEARDDAQNLAYKVHNTDFSYFNSSERAEIYGIELETKIDLIKPITNDEGDLEGHNLGLVFK